MSYIGSPPQNTILSSADIAQGSITLDDINFTDVPANMDITGTIDKHTMRLADSVTITGDVTISEDLVLAKLSDDGDAITMVSDGTTRTITGSGSIQAATLAATPQPTQTYAVGTTLTGLTGVIGPSVTGGEGLNSVPIADNSVTLAKMAGGTDGQIITYDASGNPIAVGPGTDGQVLTSTGAGSPPAFEDAAGGSVADNSITLAKMASGTDGQIITYDASGDPVAVGPGTDGQVLTSTGAGSPPAFENVSATSLAAGSTIAGDLTLETSTVDHPILRVVSTASDVSGSANHPAKIVLGKEQADNSPHSNEDLGTIEFIGDDDSGDSRAWAEIIGHVKNVKEPNNGGEGKLKIRVRENGYLTDTITVYGNKVGINYSSPSSTLQVAGTVSNSTSTTWTNYSDERIKTNIETIENGLDKLNKLRPVTYNYTEEYLKLNPELSPSKKYNSFIAQEYAEVFPDAVNTGADLENEDGEVIVEGVKDYTPHDLFMYLVKGVQELSAKNDALEARIKTLEG